MADATADAVPRETVDPQLIRQIFGHNDALVHGYVDLLTSTAVEHGLLGPREASRVWTRHVLNCAVVEPLLPRGSSVVDIGSGAGLPGLVLALARPDLRVTLVEPLLRRSSFLQEAVGALGLSAVEVIRARAEDLHGDLTATTVISRAVAPLDKLMTWCWALVSPGGAMVAIKGAAAAAEVASHAGVVRQGGLIVAVEHYGHGIVTPPTTVIRVQSQRDAKDRR
ncbi:MAG: 16S rRNA (guanine(527)-N(7))-methyltransferase RsmG [Propionibacteriales bacterium]|nr:16S rRNA (guanine(527)-N(7))-methyltransferase RsmG [Propionibacteriales bacterium]